MRKVFQSALIFLMMFAGSFGCDGSCTCYEAPKQTKTLETLNIRPSDKVSFALGVVKGIELRDFETVVGWFQDPPMWWETGFPFEYSARGKDEVIDRMAGLSHLASGGRIVPELVLVSGDTVATVYIIETSKGRRVARTEGLLILNLSSDKIAGATDYVNPRPLLVQQGYLKGSFPVIDKVPDSPSVVEGDASFPEDFESAVFAAYEALSAGYPQPFQGIIADACKVVDHLTGFEGTGVEAARNALALKSVLKSTRFQFRKGFSIKAKNYLLIQWEIVVADGRGTSSEVLTRADLFKIHDAQIEEIKIFGNSLQLFGLGS
jgi:hypothetical protein